MPKTVPGTETVTTVKLCFVVTSFLEVRMPKDATTIKKTKTKQTKSYRETHSVAKIYTIFIFQLRLLDVSDS